MFSRDLSTCSLQWTCHCKRHLDGVNLSLKRLHDLLGTSKRTVQKRLLAGDLHAAGTKLSQHRDHHSCQQSRLAHMELIL